MPNTWKYPLRNVLDGGVEDNWCSRLHSVRAFVLRSPRRANGETWTGCANEEQSGNSPFHSWKFSPSEKWHCACVWWGGGTHSGLCKGLKITPWPDARASVNVHMCTPLSRSMALENAPWPEYREKPAQNTTGVEICISIYTLSPWPHRGKNSRQMPKWDTRVQEWDDFKKWENGYILTDQCAKPHRKIPRMSEWEGPYKVRKPEKGQKVQKQKIERQRGHFHV